MGEATAGRPRDPEGNPRLRTNLVRLGHKAAPHDRRGPTNPHTRGEVSFMAGGVYAAP